MTLRNFATVASIIAFVFGIGFILVPTPLVSLYNVTLNAGGSFVGQLFGAVLVAFGVLNWLARTITDSKAVQMVVLANLVGEVLGFVISLLGQLSGVGGINALGWSTVALYLLLALGWGYFQFVKPAA